MNREAAKDAIRQQVDCREWLEPSPDRAKDKYICPYCGSGTRGGSGALTYYPDTNRWHCFACDKSGDVFDLYQQATGADFPQAVADLSARAGIDLQPDRITAAAAFSDPAKTGENKARHGVLETGDSKSYPQPVKMPSAAYNSLASGPDYSAYYAECAQRISDPAAVEYLQTRGISLETATAHGVGYDPAADPANAPGGSGRPLHPCPRIIIPAGPDYYTGRSIDPETPGPYQKMNPKGSTPALFNSEALFAHDVQEVFLVEGAFDALAVAEVGAAAVALNSTANANKLLKLLEQQPTEATLILCLDDDPAGIKATDILRDGLQRLNIPFILGDICGDHKDPNEALTADRAAFLEAVEISRQRTADRPDNTARYIDTLLLHDIERFRSDVKTGFPNLDSKAGGLYSGLYCLAAISSLGKTSFALQLADQIAQQKQEVIFFSLEQSRLELVTKSLARYVAIVYDKKVNITSLDIRRGIIPDQVKAAAEVYKQQEGNRVSIVEGNFNANISFIGDYIRQYIRRTGSRPVVFVDYLQILQPAPEDIRRNQKEIVDTTVTELKRISREMDLTVFIISSVNRANYLTPIDFEALKESGTIEYTADVVWGLQLQVLNDDLFSQKEKTREKRDAIKTAKAADPRKIELVCLKNRYGIANYSACFDYYPGKDLFEETPDPDTPGWENEAIKM